MRRPAPAIVAVIVLSCIAGCGYKTNPRPATATIPGEVGLVDVASYPDRIILKWSVPSSNADGSALQDLSGFKVYRFEQPAGEECDKCEDKKTQHANIDFQNPTNAVIEKGEITYADTAVRPEHTYSYWLSAYNLRGREGRIGDAVPVPFVSPPLPPEDVRAGMDQKGIALQWTAPTEEDGVRSYRVYRGAGDKPEEMKFIGGTGRGETEFIDKTAETNVPYYYSVRSLKMKKGIAYESASSRSLKAVLPAIRWQPPENVKTSVIRDGIEIRWDKVTIDNEETRYNVYRSEQGKLFERINPEPLEGALFLDRKAVRRMTYRYAVTAFPKGKPADESSRAASEAVRFIR